MRPLRPRKFWTYALALLLPAVALADGPGVVVRVGSHDGYGRVTFALPPRTEYQLTQQDQHVVIQFSGNLKIGPANAIPHNVVAIKGGEKQATLDVAPGTLLHDWRYGDLLVVDVRDPANATQPATASAQATVAQKSDAAKPAQAKGLPTQDKAKPQPAQPEAGNASPVKPDAATPEATKQVRAPTTADAAPATARPETTNQARAAAAADAVTTPVTRDTTKQARASTTADAVHATAPSANVIASDQDQHAAAANPTAAGPPQAAAQPVPQQSNAAPLASSQAAPSTEKPQPEAVSDSGPDGVLDIQADPQLGLAVFRLGNVALIVLDQPRTIDLASLRDDTVFGSAVVQTLSSATVIRVPVDPGMTLAPSRVGGVWRIAAVTQALPLRPVQPVVADDRLLLQTANPGVVVTIADPDSATTLLVGTQRTSGQGVPVRRRTPEFTVLSSWQGVAVEPKADTIVLRPTAQGFVIAGASALSPASEAGDQLAHSAGLTRLLDFPSQPNEVLLDRLRDEIQTTAATPALTRGPGRELVARTMMALGLGAEAGSVLRLAATDDPHLAASPQTAALAGVAALLAHRPEEAAGLINPALPAADDIVFWRAVRLAELQPASAEAAATFGATARLALALPAEMRNRVLPLVAETLVAGGETTTAAALLTGRPSDASLELARAMLAEARHDNEVALAAYDRLGQSPDRSVHARATVRAVELRLATGAINDRQAADQLDRLIYTWRGDSQERLLRERLADLQARSGSWRAALGLLRDTESLFPDEKETIHGKLREMFAALLRSDTLGTLPPVDLVALVEENADLLPTGQDGEALQARLADRLLALDLPKRAGPVIEKLMRASSTPLARAGFGARLAAMRLRENDPAEALAALDGSDAPDLPAELAQQRALLAANANARRGDKERALAALQGLDDAAADDARATILERANDWPAAQKAIAAYVARIVPPEGKLTDVHLRALLRLATAAARAGDGAALSVLREHEGPRMGSGPLADMFRLLTADPVRSTADLKRAGQEATLAGRLPGQLKALQPPTGATP